MAPHQDCNGCHGRGEARGWTVAGTMGGRGSRVTITDATGWTFTLHTAQNGNFYTAEPVQFPLLVSVDGRQMSDPDTGEPMLVKRYGGCNACHGPGGVAVVDELMARGTDCLVCHDGSGIDDVAHVYTLAGTWTRPGLTVSVRDATGKTFTLPAPTNAAGNFFTSEPLVFPVDVTVGGETMDAAPHGGCNACHGIGGEIED
jgi:hypothetical protein